MTAFAPDQLLIAPVALPFCAGALLLLLERVRPAFRSGVAAVSTLAFAAIALALVVRADQGSVAVYLLGNWPAPYGIALALDRTSALMLALTAALALASQCASFGPFAERAPHYRAIFQFQLAGLAGAFLTADIFNLFVFFEVLLIASYALLLHAAGGRALRAGFSYIVVNLVGSTLFLVAASLAYGVAGTLNLADLAVRITVLQGADLVLARAAILLLIVVFAIKAALLPFGFWLPATYSNAPAPVLVLFAIMTKVGVYAILRMATTVWGVGEGVGFRDELGTPPLLGAGLLTIGYAGCGALAASRLAPLVASLVVMSSGVLVAGLAVAPDRLGGVLYYLVHSTLIAALLFLLVVAIARQRGDVGDALVGGPATRDCLLLGAGFFMAAVAIAGLPPFSGFVGKILILEATRAASAAGPLWFALLASGLVATIALSRAGSRVFWVARPPLGDDRGAIAVAERVALCWLTALLLALVVGAGPAARYTSAAAAQLANPRAYIEAVLGAPVVSSPTRTVH